MITPAVVIRPTLEPLPFSVNHRFPSAPAATLNGEAPAVGIVNSVNTPAIVTRPISLPLDSTNHMSPSGPP